MTVISSTMGALHTGSHMSWIHFFVTPEVTPGCSVILSELRLSEAFGWVVMETPLSDPLPPWRNWPVWDWLAPQYNNKCRCQLAGSYLRLVDDVPTLLPSAPVPQVQHSHPWEERDCLPDVTCSCLMQWPLFLSAGFLHPDDSLC